MISNDSGLTSKSTSKFEDFSFIIDNFEDVSTVNDQDTLRHKEKVLENLKYTLKKIIHLKIMKVR